MLTKLNLKALLAGAVVYLLLFAVISGGITLAANIKPSLFEAKLFNSIYWIAGIIMLSAGGFVSGFLAGQRGIMHGVVVAIAGAVIVTIVASLIFSGLNSADFLTGYLAIGIVLNSLAGGVGELVALKLGRHGL